MKQEYNVPEILILTFLAEDIVCASNDDVVEPNPDWWV